MKIAFVIFNGMTSLDFIGVYDPVVRLSTMNILSDVHWDVCAFSEKVIDDRGLVFMPDKVKVDLAPTIWWSFREG